VPVAYALLTNKSEATYTRMWQMLKATWPDLEPDFLSTDFELAAIDAAIAVFPNIQINGCLFHLVRNMRKKFAELGLLQV
jgi:hypothetical protein